jgi:adenosylmethionine-8-amino-7-oxononanoate aminotransferase
MTAPLLSHVFPRSFTTDYVVIRRADGVYLYDEADRPILDGSSGAAVASLGHAHPRIVERLRAQASQVAFTHGFAFVTRPLIDLAARLASYSGDPRARVLFASGGSEAIETALKLARVWHLARGFPAKYRVISRAISYHGAPLGALSMTGLLGRRRAYEPLLLQFPRAATPFCYRCPFGLDPAGCGRQCADDIERTIAEQGAEQVAAVILEPVIGASAPGVAAPEGYLQRVADACRRHDVLLIADEVMSGAGRTGRFFAMQHWGVTPDITVVSKSLSGGYAPLAAVIVSGRIADGLEAASARFAHGYTYAGNPLSAAVGLEVLDVLEEDGLIDRAARMGERLEARLEALRAHPIVGDVRGVGLLLGVELVADRETRAPFSPALAVAERVRRAALDEGLSIYPGTGAVDGIRGDHLLIAPPFIITEAQVDELAEMLARALARVQDDLSRAGEALTTTPPKDLGR